MTSGGFSDQGQSPFGQAPFSGAPQDEAGFGPVQPAQAPFTSPPPDTQQAQYAAPPQYGHAAPQYSQAAGGYGLPQSGPAMPYGRVGRGTNSLAIAALCCGIGQVIAGPLAGIPAVILGFMSLGQIARTGEDGRGMAITGLVLGIIGLILTVLFIILFIAVWKQVTSSMVPAG
jgi:hypothetical protein